jgi:hypothetical protein
VRRRSPRRLAVKIVQAMSWMTLLGDTRKRGRNSTQHHWPLRSSCRTHTSPDWELAGKITSIGSGQGMFNPKKNTACQGWRGPARTRRSGRDRSSGWAPRVCLLRAQHDCSILRPPVLTRTALRFGRIDVLKELRHHASCPLFRFRSGGFCHHGPEQSLVAD